MEKIVSFDKKFKKKITNFVEYLENTFTWITDIDEMRLCPDDENLEQRFVAAAVMIALSQDHLLSGQHECKWTGIKCNHHGKIVEIKIGKF